MKELKDKKILYIGQKFFGYEKEIQSIMEKMGADVDYFDERANNTLLMKLMLRFKMNNVIKGQIKKYYESILRKVESTSYDYIFINKLETIDLNILKQVKTNHCKAQFILYMWDSIGNYKPNTDILKFFDRIFSFDTNDIKNFNKLELLPLFYIPIYQNIEPKEHIYDLTFIGSGHSDRYQIVSSLLSDGEKFHLSTYSFFYLRTKIMFYFRKLFDKRMKNSNINDFSFSSLTQNQIVSIIAQSNVIIDIEHPTQDGLTMRTIEMIGAKKKIITTNKNIQKYDFYNSNNIYIIDRDNPYLDLDFMELPYIELEQDIYDKYSLYNWVKTVFGIVDNRYMKV